MLDFLSKLEIFNDEINKQDPHNNKTLTSYYSLLYIHKTPLFHNIYFDEIPNLYVLFIKFFDQKRNLFVKHLTSCK